LFSGIAFSTGGYSAEYGEALSVFTLNTEDNPASKQNRNLLNDRWFRIWKYSKWNKSSSVNASYINLAPYQAVIPQNIDWNRPFQSLSGETVYRYNFNNGILKVYAAFDSSQLDINQENINAPDKIRVAVNT
jgi:hypothetical protein